MQQLSLRLRRFVLALLACCGLVVGSTGSAVSQGARIHLDPEAQSLVIGEVGTLDVCVEGVTRLAGAELYLRFDPALLEVVDADPSAAGTQIAHGDFLSADFVVWNAVDSVVGQVDYAIACLPVEKAVSGSGVLARVTFRALAEGETLISVGGVLLADAEGQPIEVETGSSVVEVTRVGSSLGVWILIGLVAAAVAAGAVAVVWSAVRAR